MRLFHALLLVPAVAAAVQKGALSEKRCRSFELDSRAPLWKASWVANEDITVDRDAAPPHHAWKAPVRVHEDVTYLQLAGGEMHRERNRQVGALLGGIVDKDRIKKGTAARCAFAHSHSHLTPPR